MAAGEFGQRDCSKCNDQPGLKEAWSCEPGPDPVYVIFPGTKREIPLYRCPMAHVGRMEREALFLYWHYREGTLEYIVDRLPLPVTAIEAFEIIGKVIKDCVRTHGH